MILWRSKSCGLLVLVFLISVVIHGKHPKAETSVISGGPIAKEITRSDSNSAEQKGFVPCKFRLRVPKLNGLNDHAQSK